MFPTWLSRGSTPRSTHAPGSSRCRPSVAWLPYAPDLGPVLGCVVSPVCSRHIESPYRYHLSVRLYPSCQTLWYAHIHFWPCVRCTIGPATPYYITWTAPWANSTTRCTCTLVFGAPLLYHNGPLALIWIHTPNCCFSNTSFSFEFLVASLVPLIMLPAESLWTDTMAGLTAAHQQYHIAVPYHCPRCITSAEWYAT